MQAQSNPTHSTNTPSTPLSPADLAEAPLTSLKLPFCQWYFMLYLGLDVCRWNRGF